MSVAAATTVVSLSSPAHAAGPVDLGSAATFGVLGGTTVANTATVMDTLVRGDLGADTAPTGFPPDAVTGETYITGDSEYSDAMDALAAAYNDAASAGPSDGPLAGVPSGTIIPGIYTTAAAVGMAAGGVVTLDGGSADGPSDGVFIFQIGGAFTMGAGAQIVLTGGTQASNVFWQIVGAAGVGANASAAGTFMVQAAVDIGAATVVNGRVMSIAGAISLNDNTIYSAPPTVTIDGGADRTVIDSDVTISGTSNTDEGTVKVTFDGAAVAPPAPTVDASGNWSVNVGLIGDGTYPITATVTDGAGNVTITAQSLTVDTVDPVVTIDGGAAATTNDPTRTITGSSDTGTRSLVELDIDAQSYTAAVQSDGSWNFTVTLPAGDHTVTATATDAAGNQTSVAQTLTVDVAAPTISIDPGTTQLTGDSTPTLTGTSDTGTGSTVTVTVNGQTLPATVAADGTWSAVAALLADGEYVVVASATDPAGNDGSTAQTLTVDTTPPEIAVTGGDTRYTNDTTPTITGTTTAAAATTVTVTVGGLTLTTLVQGDGTWNVTPPALVDAAHLVVASVSDPAGNAVAAAQTLTVDTAPPAVTVAGGAAYSTNDPTPTLTGTSDTGTGSTVTVTVAGETYTTTVAADGTWTATVATIADGTYTVAVSVTDTAGNTGTATQALTVGTPPVQPPAQLPAGLMRLTPITPTRLADTRTAGRLAAAVVLRVAVAGTPGIPQDVSAAALNITAVGADEAGFLTTYPCSATPPTTSTVNFGPGRDTANSTIATLAADGDVCIYTSTGTHVIVDITAWFAPNATNAMTATTPHRVADTRDAGRVQAGTVLAVATGAATASAVALNVTAVGADDAGFLTVFPCGTTPPGTSTVNFGPHEARPNNTIVAVAPGGAVCVFTSAAVNVIVDVTAVFSASGLLEYQPSAPQRLLDTRSTGAVAGGGQVAFDVGSTLAWAVSVNVTVTGHTADGFAATFACGSPVPETSTLNQRAGEDNANGAIVPVGAGTAGCVFTSSTTNIVVDLNGWWIQRT